MTQPTNPGFSHATMPPGGFAGGPPPAHQGGQAGGQKAAKTSRSPKRLATTNGRIAIVLAVLAALGTVAFLGSSGPKKIYVVRAKVQLPALQAVTASSLEAVAVPKNLVEPGTITASTAAAALAKATGSGRPAASAAQGSSRAGARAADKTLIAGKTPLVPILARQQIRPQLFSVELALASPLRADERLISVSAGVARGLAGNLSVGDRVDMIVVDHEQKVAGVVLQDAEIVAVQLPEQALQAVAQQQTTADGRKSSPSDVLPTTPIPGTYVLRVPAQKAPAVALTDSIGSVYLAYRAPGSDPMASTTITLNDALCGGGDCTLPAAAAKPSGIPTAGQILGN